jgi:hypothetical protein
MLASVPLTGIDGEGFREIRWASFAELTSV